MSISSTRKVSGASFPTRKERLSPLGSQGEGFVEHIDTGNNVLVKKDFDEDRRNKQEYQQAKDSEENQDFSGNQSQAYVPNAIEALEASGIYEQEDLPPTNNVNKIGIYGNNQSMISKETKERKEQSYLKHFYEKNELIEEVDKLV